MTYMILPDIDAFYAAIRGRGVGVAKPPDEASWGTRGCLSWTKTATGLDLQT